MKRSPLGFRIAPLCLLVAVAVGVSCDDPGANAPPTDDVAGSDGGDAGGIDAAADAGADVSDSDSSPTVAPWDWCEGAPPDDSCWDARREPDSERIALARRIADAAVVRDQPEDHAWQWGEAVLMLGIAELGRVTDEPRYTAYVRAWLDHHVEAGYEIVTSDTCAPAALAVVVQRDTGPDPAMQAVVDDALTYLYEESARSPEGGLSHFGTIESLGVQLWADSLFMFGNVLNGYGEYASDETALDAWAEQFVVFADLMQDDTGLFRHAVYTFYEQDDDVYWARANGWILGAAFDHLRIRRDRSEAQDDVLEGARALADAVIALQDESGLWPTVINRGDETYLETSASALFAWALARGWRYGWLDDDVLPVIDRTIRGLEEVVVDDADGVPVVTGISVPTSVGTFAYYAALPVDDDISYGVGAVLLALIETSGLPAGPDEVP